MRKPPRIIKGASEKKEANKRFIIAGQSGIDIHSALSRFKNEITYSLNLGSAGRHRFANIDVIRFEDFIVEVLLIKNKAYKKLNRNHLFDIFINSPYSELEEIWEKASVKLLESINAIEKDKKNHITLICFHCVYFHSKTSEYISAVNINYFEKIKITDFIIFIDDIYDIHSRLKRKGKMYHGTRENFPLDPVLELFQIQDWRSKEILISRFITKQLNFHGSRRNFNSGNTIRLFVFAVKHHFKVFSNLINGGPTAYLSHPISEIRRLQKNENLVLADALLHELRRFSEELQENFCLFQPTTIDEFRIDKIKHEDGEYFVPTLKERWDEDYYFQNNNRTFFNSLDHHEKDDFWNTAKGFEKYDLPTTDKLLHALSSRIVDQVSVRDYILVEQSDYLIVYRPFFNGNIAGGVAEENSYHISKDADLFYLHAEARILKLIDKRENKKIFMFCPAADTKKLIKKNFYTCLQSLLMEDILSSNENSLKDITTETILLEDEVENIYSFINGSQQNGLDAEEGLLYLLVDIIYNRLNLDFNIEIAKKKKYIKQKEVSTIPYSQRSALDRLAPNAKKQNLKILFWEDFNASLFRYYQYKNSGIFEESDNIANFFNRVNIYLNLR